MLLTSGCSAELQVKDIKPEKEAKEPSVYTYYDITYKDGSYTRVDMRELNKYRCIVVAVVPYSGSIAITTFVL